MRGDYLSGIIVVVGGAEVGEVVVEDVEPHERWLFVQCCCWFCGR